MTRTLQPVPLTALADATGSASAKIEGDPNVKIAGVAHDSREVPSGAIFFCVPGASVDGHDFAEAAVRAGAAALCVERVVRVPVPQLVVDDVRRNMARVAARALGDPADSLTLVGITGTNGKTTTAFLVESILAADGRTTGLIGTIEVHIDDERRAGIRTTPEATDLQLLFHEMVTRGVDSVAMEVTSHALVLHRVEGVKYSSAVFTNLTQDHLDFHRDMEEYFEAKRSLFTRSRCARGTVNGDDPFGQRILRTAEVPLTAFGTIPACEVRAEDVDMGPTGSTFKLLTSEGTSAIETSLVGPFNVSNCLAAAAAALQVGVGLEAIEAGIGALRAVPGRFETVDRGQPFSVVVDYAHTPDSLENVLTAGRRLAAANDGRLICVFGCGGDRDRGKRPLMGSVAARLADIAIVTSDNPRSEDPQAILGEIVEGFAAHGASGPEAIEVDRRTAIANALHLARPGDLVVIAGKGHETGQQFADRTIPFDDRTVAGELLAELGWGSAP